MYATYLAFMHSWFARALEKALAYGIIAVFGTAAVTGAVKTAFGAPSTPPTVQAPPPGPRKDCPCNPCSCADCQSGGCALPKGK